MGLATGEARSKLPKPPIMKHRGSKRGLFRISGEELVEMGGKRRYEGEAVEVS